MKKECFTLLGKVQDIGPIIRINQNRPYKKRIISIKTQDGQLVFFEFRKHLDKNIEIETEVLIDFYFAGSTKNDKNYNNIIAENIDIYEK